ncbi:hypothetical protein [Legionella septentrionalis]|uniref:Uncharacterized protein n=1 Tax=Legionella septentrionalis TaxID=2498109 RepID=A0A3S0VAL4_9GAMM|nr:hypothetical protein [Legionella septentrionalis]RUQ88039.1 hypothetical protein EKM59_06210 [Legionella septentrionalis]RUR02418.1 hypothetical protein ELY11_01445 [Legionella septentrionalis]
MLNRMGASSSTQNTFKEEKTASLTATEASLKTAKSNFSMEKPEPNPAEILANCLSPSFKKRLQPNDTK